LALFFGQAVNVVAADRVAAQKSYERARVYQPGAHSMVDAATIDVILLRPGARSSRAAYGLTSAFSLAN
jgi:hypothetical protein